MKFKFIIFLASILLLNASEDVEISDIESSCSSVPVSSSSSSVGSSNLLSPIAQLTPQQREDQFKQALERLQSVNEIPIQHSEKAININDIESLTQKTFRQLIEEHFKEYVPLIIAKVKTIEAGKEVLNYYDGFRMGKYILETKDMKIRNKKIFERLVSKRPGASLLGILGGLKELSSVPVNQQSIVGEVEFYILRPLNSFLFEYIGSSNEEAKIRNILVAYTLEDELSQIFAYYIPTDIVNFQDLPAGGGGEFSKGSLNPETLSRHQRLTEQFAAYFARIIRLNYNDQFRLSKIFFNSGKYLTAYDLLSRIIDKPETPMDIKSEAKTLKGQVLSNLSSDKKLFLGLTYYQHKSKNALELLERAISEIQGTPTQDVAKAKKALGKIYISGAFDHPKNYQRAQYLLQEALNSNLLDEKEVVSILSDLESIYSEGGFGVEKNDEKAIELINKIYDINPLAINPQYVLKRAEKKMIAKNYNGVKDLLEMAINYPEIDPDMLSVAQYNLSFLYMAGVGGVSKDSERAKALLESAIKGTSDKGEFKKAAEKNLKSIKDNEEKKAKKRKISADKQEKDEQYEAKKLKI